MLTAFATVSVPPTPRIVLCVTTRSLVDTVLKTLLSDIVSPESGSPPWPLVDNAPVAAVIAVPSVTLEADRAVPSVTFEAERAVPNVGAVLLAPDTMSVSPPVPPTVKLHVEALPTEVTLGMVTLVLPVTLGIETLVFPVTLGMEVTTNLLAVDLVTLDTLSVAVSVISVMPVTGILDSSVISVTIFVVLAAAVATVAVCDTETAVPEAVALILVVVGVTLIVG